MQKQLLHTDLCYSHFGCTVCSSACCGLYAKAKTKVKKFLTNVLCDNTGRWTDMGRVKGWQTEAVTRRTLWRKKKYRKRKWHIKSVSLICSSGPGCASIWWTLGPAGSPTQGVTRWKKTSWRVNVPIHVLLFNALLTFFFVVWLAGCHLVSPHMISSRVVK